MHRQQNQYLNCEIFTVPTRQGLKFQVELQSETGEFLACTESETGVELKTRTAWATTAARKLAEESREDGKLIKFSIRQWPAQFQVPDIDLGDLSRDSDYDLNELFRQIGEKKLVAQLDRNYILASRYSEQYDRLLAEQARRETEAKRDRLFDAICWIEAPNGPTISESAECGDWSKVLELIRPFAVLSESAKAVLDLVSRAANVRSVRGLTSNQRDQISDAVLAVKRFERMDLRTLAARAEGYCFETAVAA